MELASLDLHARQPQVSWGTEQKVYLCCLFRFFEGDLSLYKQVFDLEFQTEIRQWGFLHGVPSRRLDTQWKDMRLKGDPIWGYVHLSPFDPNGQWRSVVERIEMAAEALGIQLEGKTVDNIDISRFNPSPRLTLSQQQIVTVESVEQASSSHPRNNQTAIEIDNLPPSKRRQPEKLCTGGGKKCLWCSFHQLESVAGSLASASATALQTELPPLLYRWSNVDTQGVNSTKLYLSGLAAEAQYFSPDNISTKEFYDFLSRHVHIEKVLSPFISTMISLLAPLHRALRSSETAIISIIDPTKLGTESPAFSAQDLMDKISLKVNNYYDGRGEYLVWWKIPASAIVSSFKISDLMQIGRDCQEIRELMQLDTIATSDRIRGGGLRRRLANGPGAVNRDTGIVIGKLLALLHVPREYASLIGEGIIYSWTMKRQGLWKNFEEGIDRGYQGCYTPAIRHITIDEETEALDEASDEDMSISSGTSGTVRSTPPSPPPHPTVSVQIFNQTTQSWVDQQLAARSSPAESMHQGDSRLDTADNQDENDEDIECISIFDTDEEDEENANQRDEHIPQDLFEIRRACLRELLG